jgi:hypothetical protein
LIEAKSVQVVVGLGVEQLPTRVAPTKTPPPPKLANVVPAGNVAVIVPPEVSAPVADVVKLTTYCVLAPAAFDGDPLATVRLPTELALAGAAPISSAASSTNIATARL